MDKSPEAFRTISEVAETLDVPPHVLRFWETRFTQVKPVKRGGGRRYYRPEDVRLLRGIRGLLYDDGMTIKGVQKILRERGIRHVIGLGTPGGKEPGGAAHPFAPHATPAALSATPAPAEPAPRAAPEPAPEPAPLDAEAAAPGAPFETTLLAPAPAPAREPEPMPETVIETETTSELLPDPVAALPAGPGRKAAIAALVAELEALRAVMAGDAER
ncbi:MerR family transcriptional regulator [Amaricoccus solimangrovi]|uniref:MerR family transcriptional regulator n=1 Tax=Amaricoccus solimangrovi TaxID=2589815 RepID=A0A501WVR5_9RHOB|nr:MerR family transcriptional regulator [Amaricoccus solimangrovi]TPE51477.1 MerR family transcriptional regulator [Amaricoccus solimangrovi]